MDDGYMTIVFWLLANTKTKPYPSASFDKLRKQLRYKKRKTKEYKLTI